MQRLDEISLAYHHYIDRRKGPMVDRMILTLLTNDLLVIRQGTLCDIAHWK